MKQATLLLLCACTASICARAQYLQKPSVPTPSIKLVKTPKHYRASAGSMGLFDLNFSAGYINKTAAVTQASMPLTEVATSGQYFMGHLQESVLSNYFLAKRSKRDKKFKLGLQNTVDLGVKRGAAINSMSDYAKPAATDAGQIKLFLNYQFGIATALRLARSADVGFTYYPYVKSMFAPDVKKYMKARLRYSRVMVEYSFGGVNAVELKYIKSGRTYVGLSYTNNNRMYTGTYPYLSSDVNTRWYQLSIGRVF